MTEPNPVEPPPFPSWPRSGKDRGSASAELVLLTPLLVAVFGCVFFVGRLVLARQAVDDAARTALQAAVTMPDGPEANDLASLTTLVLLSADHGLCARVSTVTNTSNFVAGGTVSVKVTCVVRFSSLAFAGVPGSVTLSATRGGDLEPYREVGP
ncbi:MAG: TadE family protein [Acidimicrobiales bacterium]|jgi:hypothetical protein